MPSHLPALALVIIPALAVAACGDANRAPALARLADQQVNVGETLRVQLAATDPDGDRLRFRVTGLPDQASVTSTARDAALLVWSPAITDTQPGGRRYDIAIEVDDGEGGTSRQDLGIVVFPTFGTPSFNLAAGAVINLANSSRFALRVEVKDDDSTDVAISLVEGPDGARLAPDGRKAAYFSWEPTPAQREIGVHRAIFAADDGAFRVEHMLTLVLLNAEQQAGCAGTPPTIAHTAGGDRFDARTIAIELDAADVQSQVQSVVLQWTRQDISTGTSVTHAPLALSRTSPNATTWRGTLDPGAIPPGGALVHYYVLATDNDDTTGFACDMTARLPKAGYFTVALYPPGASTSACVNDGLEPDDAPGQAQLVGTELLAGRRLCPNDTDMLQLNATSGQESQVSIRWNAEAGDLDAALVDGDGNVISTAMISGAGLATLTHVHTSDAQVFVRLRPALPGTRLTWTADVRIGAVPCDDDEAEPDDDASGSRPLAADAPVQRTVCPGNADWVRFDVSAGRTYRISAAFEHRFGDLDLELYGDDGQTLLDSATSERSLEEIERTATADGTWYARVVGVGTASNRYFLSLSEVSGLACPRDSLGPVHSPGTATALFEGLYGPLVTCSEAPDWLYVDLNGGETFYLLALGPPNGGFRVDVFANPGDGPIHSSTSDGDGFCEADLQLDRGRYYYRISTDAPEANYELLQEIADPPGACQPDRFDDATATLEPGIHTRLRLCSSNQTDTYDVELQAFDKLSVLTSHPATAATLVTLRAPDGSVLATSADYGEGAWLESDVDAAGTYRVEVRPGAGTSRVSYDLAIFVD
jgi:hypothetical protein